MPIIVGGHGSSSVSETLEEIDALRVEDLNELLRLLDSLRPTDESVLAGETSH